MATVGWYKTETWIKWPVHARHTMHARGILLLWDGPWCRVFKSLRHLVKCWSMQFGLGVGKKKFSKLTYIKIFFIFVFTLSLMRW